MVTIASLGWKAGPDDRAQAYVYSSLCEFADVTGFLWPNMETIAKRTRQTVRNVRTIMQEIQKTGWVRITKVGRSHQYQLDLPKLCRRALATKGEKFDRRECEFILLHTGTLMPTTMQSKDAKTAFAARPAKADTPPASDPKPPDVASPDPAALGPAMCAREMFETLAIPAPQSTLHLAEQAIAMTAKRLVCTPHAAMLIIQRKAELARQAGETVNRFWFEDGKYEAQSFAERKEPGRHIPEPTDPAIANASIVGYIERNAEALIRSAGSLPEAEEIAAEMLELVKSYASPSEALADLDEALTELEGRLAKAAIGSIQESEISDLYATADRELAQYKGKAPVAAMDTMRRRVVQKRVMDIYGLPRLSLFYMPAWSQVFGTRAEAYA